MGRRRKEGWWAVFRLPSGRRGILGAAIGPHSASPRNPLGRPTAISPIPHALPLNAAAGKSPFKSVEAGGGESSAPWSERVILPTPRKHPVIHSGLCTRPSRDEENLVGDQSIAQDGGSEALIYNIALRHWMDVLFFL